MVDRRGETERRGEANRRGESFLCASQSGLRKAIHQVAACLCKSDGCDCKAHKRAAGDAVSAGSGTRLQGGIQEADGMGWDGMGLDAIGCDGIGWDGVGC